MPIPIVGAPVMDIVVWLRSLGLGKYEAVFRENEIDETVLPNLTNECLRRAGVGFPHFFPARFSRRSTGPLPSARR